MTNNMTGNFEYDLDHCLICGKDKETTNLINGVCEDCAEFIKQIFKEHRENEPSPSEMTTKDIIDWLEVAKGICEWDYPLDISIAIDKAIQIIKDSDNKSKSEVEMNSYKKKMLSELSKEQLLYLIEKFSRSEYLIDDTCVEASKWHISSDEALDKIRRHIYTIPSFQDATEFSAYLDMEMGKISVEEHNKYVDEILMELGEIWKKFPSLRFGQFIENVIPIGKLYYMEDDDLISKIKEFYNNIKR